MLIKFLKIGLALFVWTCIAAAITVGLYIFLLAVGLGGAPQETANTALAIIITGTIVSAIVFVVIYKLIDRKASWWIPITIVFVGSGLGFGLVVGYTLITSYFTARQGAQLTQQVSTEINAISDQTMTFNDSATFKLTEDPESSNTYFLEANVPVTVNEKISKVVFNLGYAFDFDDRQSADAITGCSGLAYEVELIDADSKVAFTNNGSIEPGTIEPGHYTLKSIHELGSDGAIQCSLEKAKKIVGHRWQVLKPSTSENNTGGTQSYTLIKEFIISL